MNDSHPSSNEEPNLPRRAFFKVGGATLGAAAFARAVAPIQEFTDALSLEEFLQKHYRELTQEELEEVLERLTSETRENYGVDVEIGDFRPQEGEQFGYALNLSICIGCRKCAEACHQENNHDRPSNNSYIRVFEMEKGGIDFEKGNAVYDHAVPAARRRRRRRWPCRAVPGLSAPRSPVPERRSRNLANLRAPALGRFPVAGDGGPPPAPLSLAGRDLQH